MYLQCIGDTGDGECLGAWTVELINIDRIANGSFAIGDPVEVDPPGAWSDGDNQYQPQVSDEGVFGEANSVRVVYAVQQGGQSAIFAADVTSDNITNTRLDQDPAAPTRFVGDRPSNAVVGNPSISDDGGTIAFDYTDSRPGVALAFVTTFEGESMVTRYASVDSAGTPARAADPALSGDGRFLTYVTDAPRFGAVQAGAPATSCLHWVSTFPSDDDHCQVVARDLVIDRERANAGQTPAPDTLVTASGAACGSRPTSPEGLCGGNATSINPSVDEIGDAVGFDSWANDLVAGDTNLTVSNGETTGGQDAFVRFINPLAAGGPLSFGTVTVGTSSSRTLTITVSGFGPYPVQSLRLGGANPGDFAVAPGTCDIPGQTLYADVTCTLTVTFTPATTGTRTATITLVDPRGNSTGSIIVTGTGGTGTGPQLSATPDPILFGKDLPLHTPGRARTLVVTNTGISPLHVVSAGAVDGSVTGAAGDYTADVTGCATVLPGKTCAIAVRWIGHAIGDRQAVLRIIDNTAGGVHLVGLQATVPAPVVKVSPTLSPVGRVIFVSGTGFAPKRTVAISLASAPGGQALPTAGAITTKADGSFTKPIVLFPSGYQGPATITAAQTTLDPSITGNTPFLISLGSLQSPTLVIRH